MIFLDLSGFQRFWASRSKSQAGIGVEAFIDLFFVYVPLITSILYAFNFGIWAAGLWLVTILLFRGDTRLFEVASTLGLRGDQRQNPSSI